MSKSFKLFNNYSGTSSERTSKLKRSVMYTAVTRSQNANELDKYQATNRDFRLTSCTDNSGSTLVSARDYKTYMDLAIGKRLINPVLNGDEAYSLDSRFGSFYRLDVSPGIVFATTNALNGIAPLPVLDSEGMIAWPNSSQGDTPTGTDQYTASASDNYKGYVLDPYNKLSVNCVSETTDKYNITINPELNIHARWLYSYWQATSGQPLSGFTFPSKVNFGTQQTSYTNTIVINAAPMTKVVDKPTVSDTYGAFDGAQNRYCGLIENST